MSCVVFLSHVDLCSLSPCFWINRPAEPFQKDNNAKTFTFRELASATKNFKQECLIGDGGFGRVFKGTLQGGEVTFP